MIMDGYLERVRAGLPPDLPAVVLPVQTIGCSIEHTSFAGTLSLAARTALAAWTEIAESVIRAGIRKLVIVNSHGGNSSIVDILAHELRACHGVLAVLASWQRFGYPDGLFADHERAHGIHGGAIETSLMLHLRPDLVRMDEARNFVPSSVAMETDYAWLRATGRPTGFGWMAEDLNAVGPAGDATAATAAKGEACIAHGADAFIALLQDVARFDMSGFGAQRP
jgi:creatinine amidohydrolase